MVDDTYFQITWGYSINSFLVILVWSIQAEATFEKPPRTHGFQEAQLYTGTGDRVYLLQITERTVSKFRLKAAAWVCLFVFAFSFLSSGEKQWQIYVFKSQSHQVFPLI